MPQIDVPWTVAGCAVLVLAFVMALRYMDRTAFLRLTIFRPWRGDPWPPGVQEQYDVAWRWQRTARVDADDPDDADVPVDPPAPTRVGHVTVGRPRH